MKRLPISLLGTALIFPMLAHASPSWSVTEKAGIPIASPRGPGYHDKIDFAELENRYPVKASALESLKAEDLATWDQESLDQLYARLASGPAPSGNFRGRALLAAGGGIARILEVAKVPKLFVNPKHLAVIADSLWHGKHFYPEQSLVRNRLTEKTLKLAKFLKKGEVHPPVVDGKEVELIPGRVYCGQSFVDSRRESWVLDYSYADDMPGYEKNFDSFVSRDGLEIREEMRMVRPGLYLGRAYAQHLFLLSFVLESDTQPAAFPTALNDACFVGTQARGVVR